MCGSGCFCTNVFPGLDGIRTGNCLDYQRQSLTRTTEQFKVGVTIVRGRVLLRSSDQWR